MNIYTFFIIFLWGSTTILVIGLLAVVFFFGRSTIKDNPNKALVYVKTGRHVGLPMKANLIGKPTKRGCRFNYGNKQMVFVPASYSDNYHKGKRMLFISHIGQLIASPFADDVPLSNDEKNELIYEICESHVGADGMKALKGKLSLNIIMVVVIAFIVGIVAVVGYNYMQGTMTPTPPINEEINLPENNTIERVE